MPVVCPAVNAHGGVFGGQWTMSVACPPAPSGSWWQSAPQSGRCLDQVVSTISEAVGFMSLVASRKMYGPLQPIVLEFIEL